MKFGATFRSPAELPGAAIFLFVFQCASVGWAVDFLLNHPIRSHQKAPGYVWTGPPRRRKQGTNATFFPDSPFKLPLKRKLQQRLWCEADMLRDILRECRCTLDYHSNESVLMSFNWLRLADKRRAISAPCRGVVPKKKKKKQRLITQNGKTGRKMVFLRCPVVCSLSQCGPRRPAETAFN